jgi:hypothetical protein
LHVLVSRMSCAKMILLVLLSWELSLSCMKMVLLVLLSWELSLSSLSRASWSTISATILSLTVCTVPAHECTYSHPCSVYIASMLVLLGSSKRIAIRTIEILVKTKEYISFR